jgi:hypothetical protein
MTRAVPARIAAALGLPPDADEEQAVRAIAGADALRAEAADLLGLPDSATPAEILAALRQLLVRPAPALRPSRHRSVPPADTRWSSPLATATRKRSSAESMRARQRSTTRRPPSASCPVGPSRWRALTAMQCRWRRRRTSRRCGRPSTRIPTLTRPKRQPVPPRRQCRRTRRRRPAT